MRIKNLLIILIFILTGCSLIVPREIKKNFANCYFENYTGIDTLIDTKGYYLISMPSFRKNYKRYHLVSVTPDTTQMYYIFFNDGTCLFSYNLLKKHIDYWGNFEVNKDTIRAKLAEPPGGTSWSQYSIWFKIIDKRTLEQICISSNSMNKAECKKNELTQEKRIRTRLRFIPYDNLPDPNKCWLKEKKWFWRDKKEYEVWRQR